MPVLTISRTPKWSLGPREGGGLVRKLHAGLWGSLWTLSQPVAPRVLKNSPFPREVSLSPAPLGMFSELSRLRCPCQSQRWQDPCSTRVVGQGLWWVGLCFFLLAAVPMQNTQFFRPSGQASRLLEGPGSPAVFLLLLSSVPETQPCGQNSALCLGMLHWAESVAAGFLHSPQGFHPHFYCRGGNKNNLKLRRQ